ncbi:unnamed protein product, partial [marine sediment metagenome]
MANELKHKTVGEQLTQPEFEAIGGHIADGQTANDMLYFNGTYWIRATAATIAALMKLDDLATPDDNTDLNASTTRHGLLKKLDNVATNFMNGQGNWAAAGGATVIRKTADQTVNNSVTLQNVADLVLPVAIGEIWAVTLLLR